MASCEEMLGKLEWEYAHLEKGWHEYHAFNFAVTAHHLCSDWIDQVGSRDQRNRRKALPKQANLVLWTWRDIVNATKHFRLKPDAERKRVVASVSQPVIADWYAYFVSGPVPYVEIENSCPNGLALVHVTVAIAQWIIRGPRNEFPGELSAQLGVTLAPTSPLSGA